MGNFTKINHQYAVIEYPVTLEEMISYSKEMPKTERAFYDHAFTGLKKHMKKDEKILFFEVACPTATSNGFIVVTERQIYLLTRKVGLRGGYVEVEEISYKDIKDVDFDITPGLFGVSLMNEGSVLFKTKKTFGWKNRTIRNIPKENADILASLIRSKI